MTFHTCDSHVHTSDFRSNYANDGWQVQLFTSNLGDLSTQQSYDGDPNNSKRVPFIDVSALEPILEIADRLPQSRVLCLLPIENQN